MNENDTPHDGVYQQAEPSAVEPQFVDRGAMIGVAHDEHGNPLPQPTAIEPQPTPGIGADYSAYVAPGSPPAPQPAGVQLPRWQSHKTVFADKIIGIQTIETDGHVTTAWNLACGAVIGVNPEVIARARPELGDYYVRYNDGYESWSPVKPFEEGYERIDHA
jgi:hypothetical protein